VVIICGGRGDNEEWRNPRPVQELEDNIRGKMPTFRDERCVLGQQMFSEGARHELQGRRRGGGGGEGTFKAPAEAGFA